MRNVLNPAIETLTKPELQELQLRRLRAQILRCSTEVPFYQQRWPKDVQEIRSMEQFRDTVPYTSKADFLTDLPEFSGRLATGRRIFEYHMTSGTTGLGQETHPLSEADHETLAAGWHYQAYWAGLRPGDKICFTWPIGLQTGGLSTGITTQRLGLVGIQLGPYSSEDKLRYMKRFQPHALVASPSYITHLSHLLQRDGSTPAEALPHLKALFIAGESYPISWATKTMEQWGCTVSEWYGLMQGATNQAFSCELGVAPNGERGTLHNLDHRVLAEVLDPETGLPVAPGQSGEMVITTLTRDAFPIVRFKSNDKVHVVDEPCPCGRQFLALEAGTVARYDDMMKVRGQNLWPAAVDKIVLGHGRIAEYAGEVAIDAEGREQVVLRVEFTAEPESPEEEQSVLGEIQRELKSTTNVTMQILRVESGMIPRFEFKARRWTDRRREDRNVVRYVAHE